MPIAGPTLLQQCCAVALQLLALAMPCNALKLIIVENAYPEPLAIELNIVEYSSDLHLD